MVESGVDGAPAPRPWWETVPLAQMSHAQWEALCDGCGKCCLHKLEDEDDGAVYYTDVACVLLDPDSCRCLDYAARLARVPGCVRLSADEPGVLAMMPPSCAYRLRAQGQPLPSWHPLVSGDPQSVHHAGMSVRGRCVREDALGPEPDWEVHVVEWPVAGT